MAPPIKIGNASAFWGDSNDAPAALVRQTPDLDFLTLDYLAEVSMSILAKQRQRDPSAGYARDFVEVMKSLAPFWRDGRKLRLVTNAGGLNPRGCAQACAKALREAGCENLKIGIVGGDDVLPLLREAYAADPLTEDFRHLETREPVKSVIDRMVTANAYVGAAPVAEALKRGADIVITGRVADPSLTVGPCIWHFGWNFDDYTKIAGATVAGHLIECGTQVTGGISTDWLTLPDPFNIGYPIVEVSGDGSCIVTKPPETGGRVSERTVKEQLLYEIGDPGNYLSPDATVSFLTLRVEDQGNNRVRVSGATGRPPPDSFKVSATYRDGFRASGMLTIFGRHAVAKANQCGEIIRRRLKQAGCEPRRFLAETIGGGAVTGVVGADPGDVLEVMLRVSVADDRREVVERFTREIAPLVSAGPQGTTGYAEGRPPVREVFGYWPTLVGRDRVKSTVEVMEIGSSRKQKESG
ncbi:MAG TPA: acyclic terpene utilization AtuA family protein [Tepidisphaeraceae bacterium]|jgi:hypothetical protein|nr:acyclic terpene utilization AtuA family protein [Tepidisphaeraceae bacterium]